MRPPWFFPIIGSVPLLSIVLNLASHSTPVHALREAHAGVLDWHKPLIGVPLTQFARTAPALHRLTSSASSPSSSDAGFSENANARSLIVTATASNVLAAIHPENGTLGKHCLCVDT
jgi:hypothetical protein